MKFEFWSFNVRDEERKKNESSELELESKG
jgi:hypothetical protein